MMITAGNIEKLSDSDVPCKTSSVWLHCKVRDLYFNFNWLTASQIYKEYSPETLFNVSIYAKQPGKIKKKKKHLLCPFIIYLPFKIKMQNSSFGGPVNFGLMGG